jgi:FkbM family methyltransferase
MKGICHVGAYDGNEISKYLELGAELIVWVEPNYFIFNKLISNTSKVKVKNIWLPLLLSDVDDKVVDFYLTSNGESSSFMVIGEKHKLLYPEICIVSKIKLVTKRFDTYISYQNDFSWDDIDMLVVDCQGADLKVLKGFGNLLKSKNLKSIQAEVNFVEMYVDNPTEQEINNFLTSFGFEKSSWFCMEDGSWGDITWTRG